MSESTPTASSEQTFKSYSEKQGSTYAQLRPGYHGDLYKLILEHHGATGGGFGSILDVGCGPGVSVGVLAKHFTHAIGLDASEGMISAARSAGGVSASSEPIRFDISTAEDLGRQLSPPVEEGSVDLITASAAAHWFDMDRFWARAALVLKPGGTVALWGGHGRMHPSMPNAAAIQAAFDDMEDRELKPYFEHGNFLSYNLYKDLPLPWTVAEPVDAFDRDSFFRKEYIPGSADLMRNGANKVTLGMAEAALGTASYVQRWREAHPDAVGTEQDVIRRMRRKLEELLHEAGVKEGEETVTMGFAGVLLMVKKRV
ncbi:methyltransferase [Stachybotrys elegans]|uniref:Methyltransferase n=1 Tax=Stachybotrys elegans TaxID=80388 RepID=A0A8K0WV04_9HYPO|nr:methyltransferase [Stachybotrys elegans]